MIWIKRFLMLALVALVVIQFFPVEKNEGGYESLEPFLAETKPSEEVAGILKPLATIVTVIKPSIPGIQI